MILTPRTNGKVWEREVAKDLNTVRTGPTGKNDADVVFEHIGIECKFMAKLKIEKRHLEQAIRNAGDRPWALLIREKYTGARIAVVSVEYGLELTGNILTPKRTAVGDVVVLDYQQFIELVRSKYNV